MTIASLLLAATMVAAQNPNTTTKADDELLLKALTATGLSFEKTSSGLSYQLKFDNAASKTRLVFVSSSGTVNGGLRCYAIYTAIKVYENGEKPSDDVIRKYFASPKKTGFFYGYKSDTNYSIRFGAHFMIDRLSPNPKSDDAPVAYLKDLIYLVNAVGDESEKDTSR